MKKYIKIFYVILCVAICAFPVFSMPWFAQNETSEKRELAKPPKILNEDSKINLNFFDDASHYLSDRFSFKSELVTLNNLIKAEIFMDSTDDVVVGTQDWLYFSKTLDDYCGKNQLSDTELLHIKKSLGLINEYSNSIGADFAFAIVPNKNTMYDEYMPYYYIKSENNGNFEKLSALVSDEEYYTDLYTPLKESKKQLYHKRDSHWNNLGAYVGFKAFMSTLNDVDIRYDSINKTVEKSFEGDLDAMIFPTLGILDEQVVFDYDFSYEYTSNFKTEEDIRITAECDTGIGSLLMYRDSFTNALLPFMAEHYEKSMFSRAMPYDLTLSEKTECDDIVIEIVERNLPLLLQGAPKMPAPQRDNIIVSNTLNAETIFSVSKSGNLTYIYGKYSEKIETADTIYIIADGKAYEAFQICDESLCNDGQTILNGFSAYIDDGEIEQVDIAASINDKLYLLK